jgi:hypothetical protein
MTDDPRKYEPRVVTSEFLDAQGDYTPDPSKSVSLPPERQRIVDTVVALYSGKIASIPKEVEAVYAPKAVCKSTSIQASMGMKLNLCIRR